MQLGYCLVTLEMALNQLIKYPELIDANKSEQYFEASMRMEYGACRSEAESVQCVQLHLDSEMSLFLRCLRSQKTSMGSEN